MSERQDENRKRATSWRDRGRMSQWADNADRLNQWAESRRQFFFSGGEEAHTCVCVYSRGRDLRGKLRDGSKIYINYKIFYWKLNNKINQIFSECCMQSTLGFLRRAALECVEAAAASPANPQGNTVLLWFTTDYCFQETVGAWNHWI